MFLIHLTNLLHRLWANRERRLSLCEEGVNGLHTCHDGVPQRLEEGIKQLLDVVVNGSLHRQCGNNDAVNVNSTVSGRG